jgi:hypothetical protein
VSAASLAKIARELRVKSHQLFLDGADKSSDRYDLLTEILSKLRTAVDSEIERVIMGYLPGTRKK